MKAIKLENVGKRFALTYQKNKAMEGFFSSFPGQKMSAEFWALRGITMEIEKGKVVGIIGRNGAGKTTLLNILAGISTPTIGEVQINGRVSSLLTLGAGFQNELSGRENIYLNSCILGMSRDEINKKYRSITEFSELDGFLNSPLKVYSQGMRLRLGFSIAIHMDFDIFLIDEILTVGDVSFQKKCFDKIEEFKKAGKTLIITTQSLDIIERLCEETILLENGEIVQKGNPQKVAMHYLELLEEKKLPETFHRRYEKSKWWGDKRFWDKREGSKEAKIIEVKSYNSFGRQASKFKAGEKVTVEAHFIVNEDIIEPHFGIAIFREDGVYCYGPNTSFDGHQIQKLSKGEGFFSIKYESLILKPGKYRFSTAIWDKNELWAYDYHVGLYKFEIVGENKENQLLDLMHRWEPGSWWQKLKKPGSRQMHPFSVSGGQWEDKASPFDIEISSIELLDSSGGIKEAFNVCDELKMRLKFKFPKEPREFYLWVGLFRNDDVYCHGAYRRIKEDEAVLIYPNLPLLSGEYYFSVGVWRKGQGEPLLYRRKASVFKMSFLGDDHGTVYLRHTWKWRLS